MAAGLHHTSVATRQHDRLVRFLHEVFGFEQSGTLQVPRRDVAALFGWPDGEGTVRSTLLGGGQRGLLEIVDAPEAADRRSPGLTTGLFQLSVEVDDVAAVLRLARSVGADGVGGPRQLAVGTGAVIVGVVHVAGLQIQVTQATGRTRS
jgi:catechol 2,3-dioxygenase-like lactoylglutathione lyase family enzyme